MSPILYTILAIVIAFIALAVWAFNEGNEGWQIVSIISSICIAIFGFVMFGTINTWYTSTDNCKVYEVLKGKHILVVSTDKGNITFENYKVDEIDDSTQFYWQVEFNHYNYETSRTLMYK